MKALVTGGGGFLGRYIVEKLIARGDKVKSFGRGDYPELRAIRAETIQGDITVPAAVARAVEGMDAVIHAAARVGVWGSAKEFYDMNVIGTRNVINACVKEGVGKLVFISSPSVVFDGRGHEGIDETHPYPEKYLAHYPRTKAIAEREVLAANGGEGLLTCAIRPHLVWGPRDTNLVPRLLERAREGKLRIVGDGGNLVDTVYVENAADAAILAADRLAEGSPVPGSAYFITQGEPVKLWDFVNEILQRLGAPPVTRRVSFGAAYASGAAMEGMYRLFGINEEPVMTRFLAAQLAMPHHFSIEKARRELGYAPAVSTAEGLERLAESMGAGGPKAP
ncbi:MAG: NAD-dependent epimerase/dehydratase family protein [Candidatus Nitrospinota bacterium M3_3B_026]